MKPCNRLRVICLKMHPKPNHKLVLFILTTILSTYLPTFFCDQTPNCNGEAFNCGSIEHLAYPFWGGSRPRMCGREGFELICHGGVPTLNISSLSYRVQGIDFTTNTLKVAREDLIWNNRCPKVLLNTTIDLNLFKYPPESSDKNVTLYYDCTDDHHPPSRLEALPNKFTCDVNGAETINLFTTGDTTSPDITCSSNIFVPVNEKDARSLENPTESSINVLQSALIAGFSVQWFNDSKQNSFPFCNANVYASCISRRQGLATSISYCNLSKACQPGVAPTPDLERQGAPPVQSESPNAQSRGYPPESGSYVRPIGNDLSGLGRPPVGSPGYHPEEDNFPTAKGSRAGKNHAKKIVIAVVPLSITGAIIVSIAIFSFLKRQRSANGPNHECNQHMEQFLLQHGSLTPKRYKYSEIKKITKSFHDKLGQGGYGSVYKGVLPDGSLVAVKVLIETDSNGEEFINEVASISRTSHVNIVSLLGFCYEKKKRALVYEFMPNKSLDKFLNNDGSAMSTYCGLDLEKLFRIAVGIAKGLEYLHTGCSTRIVHFDIKPQNILLDEEFCPKISDFGLAKLCKKKQSVLSLLGTRGTIGYIAPEVFSRNFGGVSHKSDVYSYGMLVLEMAGSKKIVETEAFQSSENYFPDKIYEKVTIDVTQKLDNFIDEEEEDLRRKMFLVGFWCIQTTPSDRPSMSKVVEMLEGSLQSIGIPPKPFLFTPTQPGQEISSSFSAHVETENSAQD